MCDNEVWKFIDGYDDYMISTEGRVMSLKYGKKRIISLYENGGGYLSVNLWKNGKKKTRDIHPLVAKAFLPNYYGLPSVDHKDRDKTNNKLWNLRWASDFDQAHNKDSVINAKHVYYREYRKKNPYYVHIMRNGERNQKYFKTEQEAVQYRNDVLAKYA